MLREKFRSVRMALVAMILLPMLCLGAVCPQVITSHASNADAKMAHAMPGMDMKMPMPQQEKRDTPACCVHHHLAQAYVPVFMLPAPVAAMVAMIATDDATAREIAPAGGNAMAEDRSPPLLLDAVSLRI